MPIDSPGRAPGLLCALTFSACGDGGEGQAPPPDLVAKAQADKALFVDTTLSASGRSVLRTCQVPERAFTADPATNQGLPVPLGGRAVDLP